jgi:hypothetical protein
LQFTINELQVDNQMLYSKNPVILYAGGSGKNKDFLSLEMTIDTTGTENNDLYFTDNCIVLFVSF